MSLLSNPILRETLKFTPCRDYDSALEAYFSCNFRDGSTDWQSADILSAMSGIVIC